MKKKKVILIVLCILILGVVVFIKPILTCAANFLIVREEPSKADVIVVLAGELTGERINYTFCYNSAANRGFAGMKVGKSYCFYYAV